MVDFPLVFTELAKQKLIGSLADEPSEMFVRVSIHGGGCAGFCQELNISDEFDPEDDLETTIELPLGLAIIGQEAKSRSARIVVDSYSALYLAGTTLDYLTESLSEGFKFIGGQAKSSCACGASVKY